MRAQTYSIDAILAMKSKFTEAPYPGFSLLDVCRKRSAAGPQRLTRGDKAWIAGKPTTSEDVIRKQVRGSLNKLAPEKYEEIMRELRIESLLEDGAMSITIDLIFGKALHEPGYSKMYAQFCYDVAMYEIQMNSSPPASDGSPGKKKSEFRNMIVSRAQQEFLERDEIDQSLSAEEMEEALASQAKRKRANIKFVGQLFLHNVLSATTMHRIVESIIGSDQVDKPHPKEIDIEVLCELLETVGKKIDGKEDGKRHMDAHFDRLRKLLRAAERKQVNYGAKVKFKLMDTIELRENSWVPRVERRGDITPATLKELEEREKSKEDIMNLKSMRSPTTKTPNRRFAPKFPESPSSQGPAQAQPSPSQGNAWRSGNSSAVHTPSSRGGSTASPKPPLPKVSLTQQALAVMREFLDGDESTSLKDWEAKFRDYPNINEDNIRQTIAVEVVKEACMTSRENAQLEACRFLINGIEVGKVDQLTAFGRVIQKAIEDDLVSDVPKFYRRFAYILQTCSGSDVVIDVYRDACTVTFFAYDQLRNEEGLELIEELVRLWTNLPKEPIDPTIVSGIISIRGGENPANDLVVALLKHLVKDSKLVSPDPVNAWLSSPQAEAAPDLAALIKSEGIVE